MSPTTTDHVPLLRDQARALPEMPGVYFWKDAAGSILYIGKAVNLRNRVTSYFSRAAHDRRTQRLILQSRCIEHEVTATELQALFRESALIKQVQPRYNRALRNSRRLFYVKLDGAKTDPWIETAREVADDGSLYFGPFRTAAVLRETIQFLHAVLPLRKCTAAKPRCKPCIYRQMHTCAAPALGDMYRQQHQEAIDRLYEILDGRTDDVVAWLEKKRDRLSESLLFERAADIQVRLDALAQLAERQSLLEAAVESRCVLIVEQTEQPDERRILLVARGNVVSVRTEVAPEVEGVARWLRAHQPLIRAVATQQSALDAAGVLERWVAAKRSGIRWIAVPDNCSPDDLDDRVSYALGVPTIASGTNAS